jgi:type IV pilus assembly protein PilB
MKLRTRHAQPAHAAAHAASHDTDEDLSVRETGRRLGELLVAADLVTPEQVVSALEQVRAGSARRLGRALLDQGVLTEHDLTEVLAEQSTLRLIDLRDVDPDPEALALLSDASARALLALPLAIEDGRVVLAVAEPAESTLTGIRDLIGRPVDFRLAAQTDLMRAIDNSYRALSAVDSQVKLFQARDVLRKDAAVDAETASVEDSAPVVQVVQMIITQALRDRASDIHIEPRPDHVRVRFRIDGALHDVLQLPASMAPAIASRLKILAGMNIVERRRPQDGQISTEVEGRSVDIRVATTAVVGGEKVVLRVLDKSRPLFSLEQLGMPEDTAYRYSQLLRAPYGMVICAGPTGSGKTTTLYGSLGQINSPERNIMTIEDPVEYTFESINQIQINEQAGITFANGLKSILRQDPDIILVGEVRDVETARIAVQSALTGHFVLSSLHATDSVAALHRLLDMGIETFLVASSVTAVLAQRLVRRICGYCRADYQPSAEELAFLSAVGAGQPAAGWVRGLGCNFCAHTGYLDRIGVYEMLPVTDAVRELVLERAAHEEIRKLARSEGMRVLLEEALRLVDHGITTVPEVLRTVYGTGI